MNDFRSHFRFTKSQRNGVFFLIIIIIFLQGIYFFIGGTENNSEPIDSLKIAALQKELDSLERISKTKKDTVYPFNPNYLTDYKAYRIGLSPEETDRLFAYRKSGKFINSAADFQKITQINDSLFKTISPLLRFPEWVKNTRVNKNKKPRISTNDINKVTADELQHLPGIGQKLAARIVNYRKLLKGYYFDDQLYEVYGIDSAQAAAVLKRYRVTEKPAIEKLNINTASFKEVLRLPYFDYKLTKRVFDFLNYNKPLTTIDRLKEIDSFPLEKFDRINLYLTAE